MVIACENMVSGLGVRGVWWVCGSVVVEVRAMVLDMVLDMWGCGAGGEGVGVMV